MKTHILIGFWRAILNLPDGNQLPFMIEAKEKGTTTTIEIINASERILVDEYTIEGDSLFIKMPVFDSEIRAQITSGNMSGSFINHSRSTLNVIPFSAKYNVYDRFDVANTKTPVNINGRWQTKFSEGTADSSDAIAIFEQNKNKLHATFLTSTGDYRYLDGVVDGDSIKLSCFDGSHAFLFLAKYEGNKIEGKFFSGIHWAEPWNAVRNDTIELPDAYAITYMKPGYNKVEFSFPNTEGEMVKMSDKYFHNKICIIQIMGTWCPNCMDETKYLAELYKKLNKSEFAIVGLAFEKSHEVEKNASNINRLKARFEVGYPILIAGKAAKDEASKALPMLNKITGYPTTIIIDKHGKVRKIHTGFMGPATGKYYDDFTSEFEHFLQMLLKE